MSLKDLDTLRTEIDLAVHTQDSQGQKTTAAGLNSVLVSLATELTTAEEEVTDPGRTIAGFREEGDTDQQVWAKALAWMAANRRPLRQSAPLLLALTQTVVYAGDYWKLLDCGGLELVGSQMATPVCGPDTEPDLSFPTPTAAGPLAGAAVYLPTYFGGFVMEGVAFRDFRFAVATLDGLPGAVFKNCNFSYNDCGVICYRGLENFQFLDCAAEGIGVLVSATATSFPQNSPYAGSNTTYADGLRLENVESYNTFNTRILEHFDAFHVASFQRPGVGSNIGSGNENRYADSGGGEYPANSYYRQPTGRLVFLPFVNGQECKNLFFKNIHVRGQSPRGLALVNTQVLNLHIDQITWERDTDSETPEIPAFELGALASGYYNLPALVDNPTAWGHPLFRSSLRGGSGWVENLTRPLQNKEIPAKPLQDTLDLSDFVAGKYINNEDGAESDSDDFTASDFVPVAPGTVFKSTNGLSNAAYYDAAKNYLGPWTDGFSDTSTAPVGAAYLRVSIQSGAYPGLVIAYTASYVQNSLAPTSTSKAPSVAAVLAALATKADAGAVQDVTDVHDNKAILVHADRSRDYFTGVGTQPNAGADDGIKMALAAAVSGDFLTITTPVTMPFTSTTAPLISLKSGMTLNLSGYGLNTVESQDCIGFPTSGEVTVYGGGAKLKANGPGSVALTVTDNSTVTARILDVHVEYRGSGNGILWRGGRGQHAGTVLVENIDPVPSWINNTTNAFGITNSASYEFVGDMRVNGNCSLIQVQNAAFLSIQGGKATMMTANAQLGALSGTAQLELTAYVVDMTLAPTNGLVMNSATTKLTLTDVTVLGGAVVKNANTATIVLRGSTSLPAEYGVAYLQGLGMTVLDQRTTGGASAGGADPGALRSANNLADLTNKPVAVGNLFGSSFQASLNNTVFNGTPIVLGDNANLLTTALKSKLSGTAFLNYDANVGINLYDGGQEHYVVAGQAGLNQVAANDGASSNVVMFTGTNGNNAQQLAAATHIFGYNYLKVMAAGGKVVVASPDGLTKGILGVSNTGQLLWNGAAIGGGGTAPATPVTVYARMENNFTSSNSVAGENAIPCKNIAAGSDTTLCDTVNGRIVIPAGKGGLYLVNMSGQILGPNATPYLEMKLVKGASLNDYQIVGASNVLKAIGTTFYATFAGSAVVALVPGDIVQLTYYSTGAGYYPRRDYTPCWLSALKVG
ncbi:MAG TPA: hypothetical protein VF629_15890 [Hymenobacter sp.]|jgi:hypothetical protein|uniref:hypothetical protein n=1 Tax=Hymenobacter sp. TaxID=1898978 RepID=UPI002ED943DC